MLGNHINIHYRYKRGWGLSPCPGTTHWLQLQEEGWVTWKVPESRRGRTVLRRRGAVGHDHAPPTCFSRDLFLFSTPHPKDLAVILAGRVGAASTNAPTELLQLFFMENTSIGQNDLEYHLVQQIACKNWSHKPVFCQVGSNIKAVLLSLFVFVYRKHTWFCIFPTWNLVTAQIV